MTSFCACTEDDFITGQEFTNLREEKNKNAVCCGAGRRMASEGGEAVGSRAGDSLAQGYIVFDPGSQGLQPPCPLPQDIGTCCSFYL